MPFAFDDNDDDELDLSKGGDNGASPARPAPLNKPAAQRPAPRTPSRPVTAPPASGRPVSGASHQAPGTRPNIPQVPLPSRSQPVQPAAQRPTPVQQRPQVQAQPPQRQPAPQVVDFDDDAVSFPTRDTAPQSRDYAPEPQMYQPEQDFDQVMYQPEPQTDNTYENDYNLPQEPAPQFGQRGYSSQEQQYAPAPTQGFRQQTDFSGSGMPGRKQLSEDAMNVFDADSAPRQQAQSTDDTEEPTNKKGKKKKGKPAKPAGGNWAGDRKKVLAIRLVTGGLLAFLVLVGLKSMFIPPTVPSRDDVAAVAQAALGQTGFPSTEGEGVATGFTRTFLSYTPDQAGREARAIKMLNYAPENVVKLIDPNFGTTINDQQEEVPVTQTVTDGPYLIDSESIDATHAVFTTLTQVNNSKWIYLQVPMLYNPDNNTLAVSGYPTFVPPTDVAKVPETEAVPQWSNDDEVEKSFSSDLTNYLKAWAGSDRDLISRYIDDDATLNAKTGLGGTVEFNRLDDLSIELVEDDSVTQNPNERRAQANVTWVDPLNSVTYSQAYRLTIRKIDDRWYVHDIKNSALVSGANVDDTGEQTE
jgi:hypothetical protein